MTPWLFICTGNYYRSRFAEAVFNHHAAETNLKWQAFSRGVGHPPCPDDGLSIHTRNALTARGGQSPGHRKRPAPRSPRHCAEGGWTSPLLPRPFPGMGGWSWVLAYPWPESGAGRWASVGNPGRPQFAGRLFQMFEMVEAAGIEPASQADLPAATTCLSQV